YPTLFRSLQVAHVLGRSISAIVRAPHVLHGRRVFLGLSMYRAIRRRSRPSMRTISLRSALSMALAFLTAYAHSFVQYSNWSTELERCRLNSAPQPTHTAWRTGPLPALPGLYALFL